MRTRRPLGEQIRLLAVVLSTTVSACVPVRFVSTEDIPVDVREEQTVAACNEVFELVATPQNELGGLPWDAQLRNVERSFGAVGVEPRLREMAEAFVESAAHPLSREASDQFAELVALCELYVTVVTDTPAIPESSDV